MFSPSIEPRAPSPRSSPLSLRLSLSSPAPAPPPPCSRRRPTPPCTHARRPSSWVAATGERRSFVARGAREILLLLEFAAHRRGNSAHGVPLQLSISGLEQDADGYGPAVEPHHRPGPPRATDLELFIKEGEADWLDIFKALKPKVLFLGVDEEKQPGKLLRKYTLMHSDVTARLTLDVLRHQPHAAAGLTNQIYHYVSE